MHIVINNTKNQHVGVDCGESVNRGYLGAFKWGSDWRWSKGVDQWEFTINFLIGGLTPL